MLNSSRGSSFNVVSSSRKFLERLISEFVVAVDLGDESDFAGLSLDKDDFEGESFDAVDGGVGRWALLEINCSDLFNELLADVGIDDSRSLLGVGDIC